MIEVPDGSLYFWMYSQGLRKEPLADIERAVSGAGKFLRQKDVDNYWRGYNKSSLRQWDDIFRLQAPPQQASQVAGSRLCRDLHDYPEHPFLLYPEIEERWVPCSRENKPLVRWGKTSMSLEDAQAWPKSFYLAENMKMTQMVVIDCDGDHEDKLDMETIMFLSHWLIGTHALAKPRAVWEYEGYEHTGLEIPASFHLTFSTDRVIPTMHFPWCHIDIIGNETKSLRYRKNKAYNGLYPQPLSRIWDELVEYIERRRQA